MSESWEDKTNNTYWEIAGSSLNGIWNGIAWQSNQAAGLNQYVQIRALGDWPSGYSPQKIRVTFGNANIIRYFLLGVSADYLYINSSASSPDTGDIAPGSKIDQMSFFAVDTPKQQFTVTKIEFLISVPEEPEEMDMALKDQIITDVGAVFYNDDEFATEITYTPAAGTAKTIIAHVFRGDGDEYKGADSYGVRATVRVKASDVAQPARSDEMTIGTERWIVTGADPSDDGLEWIVQANKVTA